MSSETPPDIYSVTSTDYAIAEIRSDLLHAYLDLDDVGDGIDFGVQVYMDGPDIALSAGTTWTDDDGSASILSYHALTVEQARELGEALTSAADRADEMLLEFETEAETEENKSLIERLLK